MRIFLLDTALFAALCLDRRGDEAFGGHHARDGADVADDDVGKGEEVLGFDIQNEIPAAEDRGDMGHAFRLLDLGQGGLLGERLATLILVGVGALLVVVFLGDLGV